MQNSFKYLFFLSLLALAGVSEGKELFEYKGITVINTTDLTLRTAIMTEIDAQQLVGNFNILIQYHRNETASLVRNRNLAITRECGVSEFSKKRNFIISLHRDNLGDNAALLSETLIHEFVHVKQMLLGRLKVEGKHHVRFDGKRLNTKKLAYVARPWEAEALRYAKDRVQ